jgi:hypothetical protein
MILASHPDEADISCRGPYIEVGRFQLSPQEANDRKLLSIPMAAKVFGFAVSGLERAVKELRKIRMVWLDVAGQLEREVMV